MTNKFMMGFHLVGVMCWVFLGTHAMRLESPWLAMGCGVAAAISGSGVYIFYRQYIGEGE